MRAIGIDLGEDSIKIAELNQSKKQIYVSALFEKKLSSNISEHDKEIECIEYVRSISKRLDFATAKVILAIKQEKVTVRKKQFPFADRQKILKSLSFEMEEDIPFDPDLCLFESKIICYEGFSAHVLAIAAPKSHIQKTINLSKDFGIEEVHAITLDGVSMSNLVESWDYPIPNYPASTGPFTTDLSDDSSTKESKPLQPLIITLNIGHKRTLMLGQIEGRVISARSISWGAHHIIQEFEKKFQIPYVEAQKLLIQKGALFLVKSGQTFEASNIANTIEKCLKDLIKDIQMSFLELQSEFNAEVHSIHLTGGLALLPNLAAYFTQQLEVATNTVSLIDHLVSSNPIETTLQNPNEIKARFSTAIGMAIEAYKKPRNPALQFYKGDFLQDNNPLFKFWNQWGSFAAIGISLILSIYLWAFLRESLTATLAEKGEETFKQQAKTVAQIGKKPTPKNVKSYISTIKNRNTEIKAINKVANMNSALEIIQKLSEISPKKDDIKIDLQYLSLIDDKLSIRGYARSPREIKIFQQSLNQLAISQKINELSNSLPKVENKTSFAFELQVDRGVAK